MPMNAYATKRQQDQVAHNPNQTHSSNVMQMIACARKTKALENKQKFIPSFCIYHTEETGCSHTPERKTQIRIQLSVKVT